MFVSDLMSIYFLAEMCSKSWWKNRKWTAS